MYPYYIYINFYIVLYFLSYFNYFFHVICNHIRRSNYWSRSQFVPKLFSVLSGKTKYLRNTITFIFSVPTVCFGLDISLQRAKLKLTPVIQFIQLPNDRKVAVLSKARFRRASGAFYAGHNLLGLTIAQARSMVEACAWAQRRSLHGGTKARASKNMG